MKLLHILGLKKQCDGDKPIRRMLIRIGILLFLAVGGVACCVDKFIFIPQHSNMVPTAGMVLIPVADPGENAKIAIKYVPPKDGMPTILFSHGNAEDLFILDWRIREFQLENYGVLVYDYEGYGASTGKPSEENCYRDAAAAYQYLIDKLDTKPEDIIIYGFSVGSGASCYLAEKFPARGLVLEAPFKSTFTVVLPWSIWGDRFPNIERIGNISMPILIFHGKKDRVISYKHSVELQKQAKNGVLFLIDNANHNDIPPVAMDFYWKKLNEFCADPMAFTTQIQTENASK